MEHTQMKCHSLFEYPSAVSLSHQVMHMFKGCRREDSAPHIYSVAQSAYRNLLTTRQDQSIVLMGKSGSGKTTNCQHLVQYLVSIAGSTGKIFSGEPPDRKRAAESSQIHEQIEPLDGRTVVIYPVDHFVVSVETDVFKCLVLNIIWSQLFLTSLKKQMCFFTVKKATVYFNLN